MALPYDLRHVGTVAVEVAVSRAHHHGAVVELLYHAHHVGEVHVLLAIGVDAIHALVHHLDVGHTAVFCTHPNAVVPVGDDAQQVVGGDGCLAPVVGHEVLACGQVLVEDVESLAVGGYPDKSVVVLHDVEAFVVYVVRALLGEEVQRHHRDVLHESQHAGLVVYPLAIAVVGEHLAVGYLPFSLALRRLATAHVYAVGALRGKYNPAVAEQQVARDAVAFLVWYAR